jgi:LysR family transcriptional regulator, hypochlorite-specific transcription factor HypT
MHDLHVSGDCMRLEWLEDILAVAETGSFIKAAERRNLTQSAFSRRIRLIEEHVGTELFDRGRKPVELKAAVRDRYREIAELAAGLRNLSDELRQQGRKAQRRIVIASQHAITTFIAPSVVQRLVASRDLKIRLRSANREDCYALLLTRQADVALLFVTERHPLGIDTDFVEIQTLGSEHLIPVYAAPHAKELDVLLSQGEIPVVVYPSDVFLGKVLTDEIWPSLRGRLSPVAKAETALTLAALQLALVGVGIAWVPEALAREHVLSRRLVDLRATLGSQRLELVAVRSRGTKSRMEEEFWQTIISEAPGIPPWHGLVA